MIGSPAINSVMDCTLLDGVTPVSTDQRGVTRPQGPACDIVAFEFQFGPPICVLGVVGSPPVLNIFTQDDEGLSQINVLVAQNAIVNIPAFTVGTTEEIKSIANKINSFLRATVAV